MWETLNYSEIWMKWRQSEQLGEKIKNYHQNKKKKQLSLESVKKGTPKIDELPSPSCWGTVPETHTAKDGKKWVGVWGRSGCGCGSGSGSGGGFSGNRGDWSDVFLDKRW